MSDMISKVTITDIARALNITAATVSRALNDHSAIKDSTKKAVRDMAVALNYRPNRIASSLRLGKSNIIGVIIPSAEINFFGSVVHGIEKIANEHNYNVLIFQSNELYDSEKKGVQTFLQLQVDGVLASMSKETINLDHFSELRRRNIPVILFDRVVELAGVSSVEVDDYAGAFEATKHLIMQGCRRIAHIGGQQHVRIFNQRLKGYIDALNVHNVPVNDDLIVFGKVSIDTGRECMEKLMQLDHPPDAVFAVEDFTALGAMQLLKARGVRIPAEVAIIGFANEDFGAYLTPSLSSVSQQTVQMGERSANLIFSMISGLQTLTGPRSHLVLEPEVICRESSLKFQTI